MPLTVADLFTSPDHYLHSFDGPDAIFVPMDHAAYRRSIFLDDRIQPAGNGSMRVPVEILLGMAEGPQLQTGWVFHVAHCGSTLLARAFEELSDNLVLREPLALRQAAVARDGARLGLMLRMLGKRYPDSGMSIVKANVPVNFVLPDIALVQPDAPAIFLFYGLEDYLLAILRSENHRAWLRRVTGELGPALGDLASASDAERGAALWWAQMRLFAAAMGSMPNVRTLDAEQFFTRPDEALSAAIRLFGIGCTAKAIGELVEGPLLSRYAKNPTLAFDNASRVGRRDALRAELSVELADASAWLRTSDPDIEDLLDGISRRAIC